ncbi:hypothetical protein [Levilactobacillus fujinensis]|uniref:Uncharacterized protein n=1 Tax=Levilactobacillus fujinensis TaxID=2486024 RepID=A0ABW1TK64_9LACO|nr:hypothetical protein [Levilactobacillus fujinensis]
MEIRAARRQRLEQLGMAERHQFYGRFERYGYKAGYRGEEPTLLLREVRLVIGGKLMANHLWFNLTKGFGDLGQLQRGDIVQFNGRVDRYVKGYQGVKDRISRDTVIDYHLSRPTQVKMRTPIDRFPRLALPTEQWQVITLIQRLNPVLDGRRRDESASTG